MKSHNNHYLAAVDVPAVIAVQTATNIAARVTTYPVRPLDNTALLWKHFDADTKIAEREIKEVSLIKSNA